MEKRTQKKKAAAIVMTAFLAAGVMTGCGGAAGSQGEEGLRRQVEETEYNGKKELLDQLQGKEEIDSMQGEYETMEISSAELLEEFKNRVNGGEWGLNAVLTADIDLSSLCGEGVGSWTPIAPMDSGQTYNGIFDGGGHEIKGLYMEDKEYKETAFIVRLGTAGVVRNVSITESTVKGSAETAGLVYESCGVLENCSSSAEVTGREAAGLVFYVTDGGIVTGCRNTGSVTGETRAAGVIARGYDAVISDCGNEGSVMADGEKGEAAGVVSMVSDSTIDNCWNSGGIHAKDTAGGVAGSLENSEKGSVMTGCYNTGSVTGESRAGGVGGSASSSVIDRCYNTGAVDGKILAAGVTAAGGDAAERSVVANCYNRGAVSSENFASGVSIGQNCAVVNCFNLGGILSQNAGIGGSGGVSSTGVRGGDGILWIANCYSAGALSEKAGGVTYQRESVELESVYYQNDTAAGYFFNRKDDAQDSTYAAAKDQFSGQVLEDLNAYADSFSGMPDNCVNVKEITLEKWISGTDGYPVFELE